MQPDIIDQKVIRLFFQIGDGTFHGVFCGIQDIDPVDLFRIRFTHSPGCGIGGDDVKHRFPFSRCHQLAVANAFQPGQNVRIRR